MRQATVVSDHEVQVEDAPEPEPAPGEVLVQPRFVGLCGSDVHIFEGLHPGVVRPLVLGHECTGVVVRSTTAGPPAGTPVGVVPLFGCGACAHCRLGETYICLRREVMGFHRRGCLAELLALPPANVLPLPDGQDLALRLGFDAAAHLADLVVDQTARPLAFDCVGRAESADAIFDVVPAPRVAVLVGTYPADAMLSLARLKRWETRVVGSQIYTIDELRQALEILASPAAEAYRRLQVQQQYELAQIRDALEAARSATAGTKVVVRIDQV